MSKKSRRTFTEEEKRKAVDGYISGSRSAMEVATDIGVAVGLIYRWKSDFENGARSGRVEELTEGGATRAMA